MTDVTLHHPRTFWDWWRIYLLYRLSFPRSERKPFSVIRRMHREGRTVVWYAATEQGRFAGMAATIEGDQTTLLDYFAVPKRLRGQGIGTAFLQRLIRCYDDRGLFVEIEAPEQDDPADVKQRRKQFYLRNGLTDMHVTAILFGVRMELLGRRCSMDFDDYRNFYYTYNIPWAAEHVVRPQEE